MNHTTPESTDSVAVSNTTYPYPRVNIPTAEMEPVFRDSDWRLVQAVRSRRNQDLDPQLVWSGKDEQDLSDLVVPAPPLFTQEKVDPKVLINDLLYSAYTPKRTEQLGFDLFGDDNLSLGSDARTEFYQHGQNWSNRLILGDSLLVMAS